MSAPAAPPDVSLVEVRCPHCDALWDRREAERDQALHEVRCRCKRLIRYRVAPGGRVLVTATL